MQSDLFNRIAMWFSYVMLVQFRKPQIEELRIVPWAQITITTLGCVVAASVLALRASTEVNILLLLFPLLDKLQYVAYYNFPRPWLVLVTCSLLAVCITLCALLFAQGLHLS